jgi:hypothetical protein
MATGAVSKTGKACVSHILEIGQARSINTTASNRCITVPGMKKEDQLRLEMCNLNKIFQKCEQVPGKRLNKRSALELSPHSMQELVRGYFPGTRHHLLLSLQGSLLLLISEGRGRLLACSDTTCTSTTWVVLVFSGPAVIATGNQ